MKSSPDPGFYDGLETRAPEAREAALMAALPRHIAHAKQHAPGWARILKDVDPAAVTSRDALAKLPVTRKSELADLQKALPPLGGLTPSTTLKGRAATGGAPRARSTPRAFALATSC
jgi:phenylacetate-coenzyme A ligase PaaK-like adenylate-forming protein